MSTAEGHPSKKVMCKVEMHFSDFKEALMKISEE